MAHAEDDVPAAIFDGESGDWRALPPAARVVRSIAGAISGFFVSLLVSFGAVGAIVQLATNANPPRSSLWPSLAAGLLLTLAGVGIGAWLGRLRWKRTRWQLDALGLHVRRGLIWQTEVLIPRSRVQHLDIERGPLERQFRLATLVVHTAGTQTQALRQSGLAEPDAVALRDALIPDAARHGDAL
jgi:membrane protein YdbS with pleckstrin-like domain